jgi:hypothetical protein
MRAGMSFMRGVLFLFTCVALLASCAGRGVKTNDPRPPTDGLTALKMDGPVELRLKVDPKRVEKVQYHHQARSVSYENEQIRHEREEKLEFLSQAETLRVQPELDRFTQVITVLSKDGTGDLNDFAMPEVGERLEVTANSRGKIFKSGDYPENSIFFVPPVSLPEEAVKTGDTWTMQASWLSLGEMIPYQLDMVSILKGFVKCGENRCADIEISGEVRLQGAIAQAMNFQSLWRGRVYFNIDAGTVVWSRVNSDESFSAGNVRRSVNSCLEAALTEPEDVKIPGIANPACAVNP